MACYDLDHDFKIHHGGYFECNPELIYCGGSVDIVHVMELNLEKLHVIARQIGYTNVRRFHYRNPVTKQMRLICDEYALYEMIVGIRQLNEGELWLEHADFSVTHFLSKLNEVGNDVAIEYNVEHNEDNVDSVIGNGVHNNEGNEKVGGEDVENEGLDSGADIGGFSGDDSGPESDSGLDDISEDDDQVRKVRIKKRNLGFRKKKKQSVKKSIIPWEARQPLYSSLTKEKKSGRTARKTKEIKDVVKIKMKEKEHVSEEESDPESVYYDSDNHDSPAESDDDGLYLGIDDPERRKVQLRREPQWPGFDPNGNPFEFEPRNEMVFSSSTELKFAFRCYAVSHCRGLRFVRSSPTRIEIKCVPNCPWRMWASPNCNESWQIKVYEDNHICAKTYSIRCANSPFWARVLQKRLINNPRVKVDDMVEEILQTYKVDVKEDQCYQIRKLAHSEVDKCLKEHYLLVRDYANELLRSNPGSTVKVEVDRVNLESDAYFKRFYVCFAALKKNFSRGCRRVIGVDGCFLKGYCKGEILTVVGRDGNNNIYPLAWAVVRVENNETWAWFFSLVISDLNLGEGEGLIVISDQQKGIINAVQDFLPHAEHRQCARHIYQNFRSKDFKSGELKQLFWRAAKSGTKEEFKQVMLIIRGKNAAAADYLEAHAPETWCRAWFKVEEASTCDSVENNLCEVFNGVLIKARYKLLIPLLEDIRKYVMKRCVRATNLLEKWEGQHRLLCPRIQGKLEKNKENHVHWRAEYVGKDKFEVRHGALDGYTVDLSKRTCACRQWQLSGIPCAHSVVALNQNNLKPEDYVSKWFRVVECKKAYTHFIKPVNGISLWPKSNMDPMEPPIDRRMPGRPKKARRKSVHEEPKRNKNRISKIGVQMTCSNCQEKGHNKSGCKMEKKSNQANVGKSTTVKGKNSTNQSTMTQDQGNVGRTPTVKGKNMGIQTSLSQNQANVGKNSTAKGKNMVIQSSLGHNKANVGKSLTVKGNNSTNQSTLSHNQDDISTTIPNNTKGKGKQLMQASKEIVGPTKRKFMPMPMTMHNAKRGKYMPRDQQHSSEGIVLGTQQSSTRTTRSGVAANRNADDNVVRITRATQTEVGNSGAGGAKRSNSGIGDVQRTISGAGGADVQKNSKTLGLRKVTRAWSVKNP